MRFTTLTLLSLLLPLTAVAQQQQQPTAGDIELEIDGRELVVAGPGECDREFLGTWRINSLASACTAFQIWVTEAGSCEEEPPTAESVVFTLQRSGLGFNQASGEFTVDVSDLPIFQGEDALACDTAQVEADFLVCGAFEAPGPLGLGCSAGNNQLVSEATPPIIGFDTIAPDAPNLIAAEPLNRSIAVRFSVEEDVETVTFTAVNASTGEVAAIRDVLVTNNVATLTGLENNVVYEISAIARDDADNVSPVSNTLIESPIATCGFYCALDQAGGGDVAGCSAAGGGALGIFGLLAGGLLFARRRWSWR